MRIIKKTGTGLLILVLLWGNEALGQDSLKQTSSKRNPFYKSLILPASLIGAGLLIKGSNHGLDIIIRDARNATLPDFHTNVDDYLQYAPIVAVYGLDWMGVTSKNDLLDKTVLLVKAEILTEIIVYPLKNGTNVLRPDSSAYNSFPSGHTSQAFAAATFLHHELGQKSVWYSIGAYACATAVGTLRILNNRHWLSDVLVGAGIGIFSTNLVYYTHRHRWAKKSRHATVMPTYGAGGPGLYVAYKFR